MYYQGVREALAHIIHNKNIRQILFQNPDAVPNIVSENMLSNNDNILQFQRREGEIGAISSQLKPWARMSQEERKQLLTSLNATLAGRNQYNEQLLVYDMIMAQIGAPGYSGASPHAANTGSKEANYRYARKRADAAGVNLEQAENDLLAAYNIRNEDPAPIIEAAKSGDINRVSHLITIGADVNTADSNGDTPLMVSLRTGKADVATELIKRGAEINHRNNAGMTPLLEAVTHGHFDLATSMIANGADYTVKTPGENGKSIEEILVEYREAHPNEGNAVEGVLSVIQRQKESVVNTGQQEQPAPSTTPGLVLATTEDEKNFLVACRSGNLEEINRLLSAGVNPNVCNEANQTGLMFAAVAGRAEAVDRLLQEENIIVDARDNNNNTALILSGRLGNTDVIQSLLSKGADVNAQNVAGTTALMWAAPMGHSDATTMLLEAEGINVNLQNKNGQTALDLAQNDSIKNIISSHGGLSSSDLAQQNPQNNEEENGYQSALNTPLIVAIRDNNKEEALRLIRENPMLVNTTNRDGDTPLHWAAINGDADITKALIDAGANIHTVDGNGDTPIMHAAKHGSPEVAALLIDKGARFEEKDSDGRTPLILAAIGQRTETMQVLIEKGADVNAVDNNGQTALIHAAIGGNATDIDLLIKAGANINVQDNYGDTALSHASVYGHNEAAALLTQNGADATIRNSNGDNALDLAENDNVRETIGGQQIEVVRHRYGADNDAHTRAVQQAKNRINRAGRSRQARRQRAALGGRVGMETATANALANIREMEKKGLLPMGPGGQSNAEVYLYRMQQARLFYSPSTKLQMSDGSYQTADQALGSGDMTFRQVYDALISGQITDPAQLESLARSVQLAEGCINNKGQARTNPRIPVSGMSYAPGDDRQVSVVKEQTSLSDRLRAGAEREITEDQGLQNAVANNYMRMDGSRMG